jgi:pimeloyl-ACP methyl ester carboxylesterase
MKGTRQLIPKGVEERTVSVDGHRVRYLTGGNGPPLLFVHGLMGFSFSWSEVLPDLNERFRTYAPDMLNLGFSERADVDPSLTAAAERMLRFMDVTGIDRCAIVASSQGGAIGMKMCVLAPKRFTRAVLVSPAHPFSERSRWQIRLFSSWIGLPLAIAMSIAPRMWMSLGLFRLYGSYSAMKDGTIPTYSKPMGDARSLQYLLRVARRWNTDFAELEREMGRLRDLPVLLVWGEKDVVVPLKTVTELRKHLQHSELAVIKAAGHLPYEEAPEEFVSKVSGFLRNGTVA